MEQKSHNIPEKNMILRQVITVAVTFVLLVAVIFVYLNKTLGWFANNKNTTVTGMGVKVITEDAQAEYYAYIYDAKETRVIYTGDPSLDSSREPRIDNLDMQFHDTIFKQRNRYTPAIIRIRLSSIKGEWANGGKVVMVIERNTNIAQYATNNSGDKILNNYFTSIMRFTLAQNKTWYDEVNSSADEPEELYFNLDEALYETIQNMDTNEEDSKVFVTASQGNISKDSSITLKVSYTSSDLVDGHLDVYLYLTYDVTLVEAFEHQAGGIEAGISAVGNIAIMENDMSSISISFENNN